MARYGSALVCFGAFEDRYSKAAISVEVLQIVFLILIAIIWLRAQKKTPYQFEVLKNYNFGLTILFWLIYAIILFVDLMVTSCAVEFTIQDSYRVSIIAHIFYWIAMCLLLSTVLLPIPRGLDRLHTPITPARNGGWTLAARILVGIFAVFTVVYLSLYIWALQSAIDRYSAYDGRYSRSSFTAFPQYIYVYMALVTAWLVLALAAAAKILLALRAASASWTVPASLKGWAYALCFSLFAFGFVRTFFAYWTSLADGSRYRSYATYVAVNVTALVLPTFFVLLALLATVQVAEGVSAVLAHPDLHNFGRKERRGRDGRVDEDERGMNYGGVVR